MKGDSEEQPRLFTTYLSELSKGDVVDRASRELQDIIRAVYETGQEGSLTLKLTVKPPKKGSAEPDCVFIATDVTSKKPKPGFTPSMFFVTDGFNLSRRDPRQDELPLREVKTGNGDTTH